MLREGDMDDNFQQQRLIIWQESILEAESKSGHYIEDCLRHYLVITLDHFTLKTDIGSHVIAIDFLNHVNGKTNFDINCLRNTGDLCLILSGLFPESIKNKNISNEYVIGIGQHAYDIISCMDKHPLLSAPLFKKLRDSFPELSLTLSNLRN